MIKTKTYFFTLTLMLLTFTIYHFESKVDSISSDIKAKEKAITKYNKDIRMYKSEWSYQVRPSRLSNLVLKSDYSNFVSLSTPDYLKFSNLNDLPEKSVHLSQNQY